MSTYNCTQCIRPMTGPPFFRNAKGWLVCFDCLVSGQAEVHLLADDDLKQETVDALSNMATAAVNAMREGKIGNVQ